MATKEQINSKLLEEVEKRPILYDTRHSDYSRRDLRLAAWTEVSTIVSEVSPMTVDQCKERWMHLRSTFLKDLSVNPSGSASKNKTPYYLAEKMKFLTPYRKIAPQQERERGIDDSYNEEIGQSSQSPGPHGAVQPPTQSQPCPASTPPVQPQELGRSNEQDTLCNQLNALAIPNDEYVPAVKSEPATPNQSNRTRSEATEKFLLSLLPDLEFMTDNQLRQFRRKCLDAIEEILSQNH